MTLDARRLALAVIRRAVWDLTGQRPMPGSSPAGAYRFLLTRNPVLDFWCAVAGIDPDVIVSQARRALRDEAA